MCVDRSVSIRKIKLLHLNTLPHHRFLFSSKLNVKKTIVRNRFVLIFASYKLIGIKKSIVTFNSIVLKKQFKKLIFLLFLISTQNLFAFISISVYMVVVSYGAQSNYLSNILLEKYVVSLDHFDINVT